MIFNQTYVSPPYVPLLWNDTGHYDYFYIDFKKTLAPFSIGMFIESILVYGTAPITITALEKINATTYKVYANISGLIHGFVVMSKSPTRLKFITGKELPAFSTFAFVSGIASYLDSGYIYEIFNMPAIDTYISVALDTLTELSLPTPIDVPSIYDPVNITDKWASANITETTTITLI